MAMEQFLIFLVFLGIALLQLLTRALKNRGLTGDADEGPEAGGQSPKPGWTPHEESPYVDEADDEPELVAVLHAPAPRPVPPPVFVPPPPPVRVVPTAAPPRASRGGHAPAKTAAAVRRALHDQAGLQRAMALVAILGPPRALRGYGEE